MAASFFLQFVPTSPDPIGERSNSGLQSRESAPVVFDRLISNSEKQNNKGEFHECRSFADTQGLSHHHPSHFRKQCQEGRRVLSEGFRRGGPRYGRGA